jgi:hypothetical protein
MTIKKPKNISRLRRTNITKIKSFLEIFSEDIWNQWDLRQKVFTSHKTTKTYPLFWSFDIEDNNIFVYKKNINSELWDLITPELDYLTKKYKGNIIKCMFVLLPPNEKIYEHWDSNLLLLFSHRVHLPIKTNKKVKFFINKIPYFLREGILYEFNNQNMHYVENNSEEDRIHLIIDILPSSSTINVVYTSD